jgi:prepilin-type N-terminal cleavage/methylation domain-containing protein
MPASTHVPYLSPTTYHLQPKFGYTLIELMIAISIIGVLVTFGLSAYGRAQESQLVKAGAETILEALSAAQKEAITGTRDCAGEYLGQEVIANGSTIGYRALCKGGDVGSTKTHSIGANTFAASYTLTFRPLNQGVDLGGAGTTLNLDFVSPQSKTYRTEVSITGTIRYLGKQ